MKNSASLSDSEQRLLHEFLVTRPKRLAAVNALIAVAAVAFLMWLESAAYKQIIGAALAGSLIGVYFEQRHLRKLRDIFKRVTAD